MLSDTLSDLAAGIRSELEDARTYQRECPDIYEPKRAEIDAALQAVEATLPALDALRIYYDTLPPPDETAADVLAERIRNGIARLRGDVVE